MTLASGGSPMFPLVVYQTASPSIWPAVQSLRRDLSTNPGVTMWCVGGHSGDGCVLMSNLCMYDLKNGDLCASFVSSQCCILPDLQFVNAGQGCKRHTPEPVS